MTKKIRKRRILVNIILCLSIVVILFTGYNIMLRINEKKYSQNLEDKNWKLIENINIPTDTSNSRKLYELKEGKVTYNTYIMSIKSIKFKYHNYSPSVIASEGAYKVGVTGKDKFYLLIDTGKIKTTVQVNSNLDLINSNPKRTKKQKDEINKYVQHNKHTYLRLLKNAREKKASI